MAGENGLQSYIGGVISAIAGSKFPWWYPSGARGKSVDFFTYGVDFLPLTASQTLQREVNISGDSAFCILASTLVESDTANTTFLAIPPLLVRISLASGYEFSNARGVHASSWFGNGQEPFFWTVPRIVPPNETLVTQVQNLEAVDRNVRVDYHGFRIYSYKP